MRQKRKKTKTQAKKAQKINKSSRRQEMVLKTKMKANTTGLLERMIAVIVMTISMVSTA